VKESIFNIIQFQVADALVLDLFAGTGNLGLEALSRGSRKAVFVEKEPSAIKVLRKNCVNLGYLHKSTILSMDVLKAIKKLSCNGERFDIVFMDPPYEKGLEEPVLRALSQEKLVADTGVVIVEHRTRDIQPETIEELRKVDTRIYGNTSVSFYKRG